MQAAAVLYDGQTAAGHEVQVWAAVEGVQIAQGEVVTVWPLAGLRQVAAGPSQLVLTLRDGGADEQQRDMARLVITDAALIDWLRRAAPDLQRRDVRPGSLRRLSLWLGAAVGAVGLILFVLVPAIADVLARNLSPETEVAFGDAVSGQMEALLGGDMAADLACTRPAGVAALEKLRVRLVAGQVLPYDLKLRVFDHGMVNAFAVPGGQIVILRGLLDKAESAAEVAGVLGHELGHVAARDPTRLAFRAAGSAGILSLLFGDVSGGAVLGLASTHLMSASYTREAEAAADLYAFRLMDQTGIGTAGLAAFFDRIDGMDGEMPDYLSTHPDSGNRAQAARDADTGVREPALTDAEWRDLKRICG